LPTHSLSLLQADPRTHFAAIANLLNTQETEPNTADSLNEWYCKRLTDGIQFIVAVSQDGIVHGFYGIYRSNLNIPGNYAIYLIVTESQRGQGLGTRLYDQLDSLAHTMGAKTLRARVRDTCEQGLRFALQRGFAIKKHSIEMMFDLAALDDLRFASTVADLKSQGFRFTNMAELGDTAEARRKLYVLNNAAAATDPGSDGIPPWSTFEEFERDVCKSTWYHPEWQIVAIDASSGEWAAMSAITIFEGADHAYNLFTGTDIRYRRRKLAQAVKSLALRQARIMGVNSVRTSHNSENVAMIAIDTKLGYIRTPGTYILEKELAVQSYD
jgi:L-amino acid N-acyltransferase YncA/RimJ/RimL family protein N-acetyltransferase